MPQPLTFVCCYCHYELVAAPEEIECMIECRGCGRSVLVPHNAAAAEWPAPPVPPTSSWLGAGFVAIAMALAGGVVGGGLLFTVVYIGSLNWIGIAFSDAVIAGGIGCLAGMFACGVLGWNIGTR